MSLVSLLASTARALARPDWIPTFMNLQASLIVLFLLAVPVAWVWRRKVFDVSAERRSDLLAATVYCVYVALLWPSISWEYNLLLLLILLPVGDYLYAQRQGGKHRWLWFVHALLLGAVFSAPEVNFFGILAWRSVYLLAAFLVFVLLAYLRIVHPSRIAS